ncbi:MAG: archaellin/type IV pilin N-terminal domain-containing protein [Nanoarchaeota archaeon]
MIFFNKRGISPLIATVLLIGFTVALAAVVITWGTGFVQKVTTGTEERTNKAIICTSDLNFEITKVTCKTSGATPTSTVILDNKGSIDVKGLALRFFSSAGDSTGVTNIDTGAPSATTATLKAFEVKTLTLYPGTTPQVVIPAGSIKLEAIATVQIDGQNVTCSELVKQKTFTAC